MKLKSLMILILSTVVLAACGGETELEPESAAPPAVQEAGATPTGTRADPYVGQGVIQEVRDGELIIQHEAIPGFMGAMTMGYPVGAEVNIESLAAGDEIMFDLEMLEPEGYRIFRVETMRGQAAPE